jgi:BolA-like protein 1
LSGCTAEEIVRIQPDFIAMLGLQQSLTPSRNNGFLNMFKLMQGKALEIYLQQQKEAAGGGPISYDDASASDCEATSDATSTSSQAEGSKTRSGESGSESSNTPVADSMRRKLETELQPLKLDINDDSNKHAGHGGYKGNASYSGETHFMVEVVSEKFEGLSSLKRHRLVYQIIDAEMGNPVHALSLITKTPAEAGMA